MKASHDALEAEAARSESTKKAETMARELARLKEIADKKKKRVNSSQRQFSRFRGKDVVQRRQRGEAAKPSNVCSGSSGSDLDFLPGWSGSLLFI